MYKEIIVQVTPEETAVAVLEDQKLMEVYLEKPEREHLAGNIYRGKIINVLPGMQAAFVDIGLEKNAFLYVEDAYSPKSPWEENKSSLKIPRIDDLVKEGQVLTVQVVKEPLGTKGARVTSNITLPGRFLVLMPTYEYIAISRKIEDEDERARLREIVENIITEGTGVIIRTAAAGVSLEDLKEDYQNLMSVWENIKEKSKNSPPALIHRDLGLLERILRDILTKDVNKLLVNSRDAYYKTMEFVSTMAPYLKGKVVLRETDDLFSQYNVTSQIAEALKRKVWLNCGGYLVIDEVEALTVIDVNTGKYIGSTDLAETVLKTNLDAAVEIARQLRLRNIGGIIIIDFIDMEKPSHQQQVLDKLEEELKKDKVKTNLIGMTQLGLVQLTRKKVSPDLKSILQKDCPHCHGTGSILSEEAVSMRVKKEIMQALKLTAPLILVEANSAMADYLRKTQFEFIARIEKETGKKIVIKENNLLPWEEVKITKIYRQDEFF